MFAHQVIEDLKTWYIQNPEAYNLRGAPSALVTGIQKAHCFHFGDQEEVYAAFKRYWNRSSMWLGETGESIKLPYDCCWFDFTSQRFTQEPGRTPSSKRGFLIKKFPVISLGGEKVDLILAFLVHYLDEAKSWHPSCLFYLISPNRDFKTSIGGIPIPGIAQPVYCQGATLALPLLEGERLAQMPHEGWVQLAKDDKEDLGALNFALMLLNCRNITTETVPAPENLNKKRAKKGKQPIFSYHTLVIKPMGKNQKSTPKHLWENRIHLQRGHFKTYTKESPLFGRYTGRFWWQPHVRGQNKDGVVMKDYSVDSEDTHVPA